MHSGDKDNTETRAPQPQVGNLLFQIRLGRLLCAGVPLWIPTNNRLSQPYGLRADHEALHLRQGDLAERRHAACVYHQGMSSNIDYLCLYLLWGPIATRIQHHPPGVSWGRCLEAGSEPLLDDSSCSEKASPKRKGQHERASTQCSVARSVARFTTGAVSRSQCREECRHEQHQRDIPCASARPFDGHPISAALPLSSHCMRTAACATPAIPRATNEWACTFAFASPQKESCPQSGHKTPDPPGSSRISVGIASLTHPEWQHLKGGAFNAMGKHMTFEFPGPQEGCL